MRVKSLLGITLAAWVAIGTIGVAATPAHAAGPRPLFQMPFPCGEVWRMGTYAGHDDYEIDMTRPDWNSLGRPIVASFAGTVIASGYGGGAGNFVRLYHVGGWQTEYYHMVSTPIVSVGQQVARGNVLGRVGSTGNSSAPHLHYAQRADGTTSSLGTVVQSYFNGQPVDITDDDRQNSFLLTSNNCGVLASPRPRVVEMGDVDVNGDGRADLVAQNGESVWVRTSTGSSFNAPALWATVPFYGTVANLAGDVNGDGRIDLIAQNGDSVWVMLSTGGSFSAPALWATVPFYGTVADHIADVNGDGRADLIAQNGDSVWVRTSTGSSFRAPALWATVPFYGTVANLAGDVNGDGRADLIAQNDDSVWVRTSTGSSFSAPALWAVGAFYGTIRDHADDVNGDGRIDLIAQNGDSVWVMLSTGRAFSAPALWATVPFYGGIANHAGDVNGDGRADLMAQNGESVWVRTSTGSSLNLPALWAVGAFYGSIANLG